LLCNDPLLNEPGVSISHLDNKPYNEIILYSNLDIAVCDIITKKPGVHLSFFEHFYPFIKENFIKNFDKLLAFAENKYTTEYSESTLLRTGYYSMCVNINYKKVIDKLKETKLFVDNL
jgi:hypothetical protein